MNVLAKMIDDYVLDNNIKYVEIAKKMGVSRQYIHMLLKKKNFTIEDANRILNVIDKKLLIRYSIVDKDVNVL